MKPNTAYAYVTGIKSIMSFYDVNLKLKVKKPRSRANDFIPSIAQLREVFEVGDLTEKTMHACSFDPHKEKTKKRNDLLILESLRK